MEGFWGLQIFPENGIMEWWNAGILVFKRILVILILSSILPVAGPLIQHCIILSEPEARTCYFIIPLFHHSNCERSELTCSSVSFFSHSKFDVGRSMFDVHLFRVRPARNALKPVWGKSNNLIHNSMIMLTQRTMHGRRVFDVQSFHCSGQA
jgi:hypothetical protein